MLSHASILIIHKSLMVSNSSLASACGGIKSPDFNHDSRDAVSCKEPSNFSDIKFLLLLDDNSLETLGVLDVDGLDVAVKLLGGVLVVVTLAGDADAEAERNALDTLLPDLLVELGVEADILGALRKVSKS